MNKQNGLEKRLKGGQRYIIKYEESGSKAIMPIMVDNGYEVEVIKCQTADYLR